MLGLEDLQKYIKDLKLLYIENTIEFRRKVTNEVDGFFKSIYVAKDIEDALRLFKKHHSKIVIIDVDLPSFNWLEIAQEMISIQPQTKIIIISKDDEQKYLYDAIDIGITKFLKKPIEIPDFMKAVESTVDKVKRDYDERLFHSCLQNNHNYNKSLVLLLQDNKPLLANGRFLSFFDVDSIEMFNNKHKNFGSLFLEHDGFLYDKGNVNWLDEISINKEKIYNVILKNKKDNERHFLLKYHVSEENNSYAIVSFNDVSNLNIAKLFNVKDSQNEETNEESTIANLLQLIYKNNITVHLYNYYKGLTIINDATIETIKDKTITLKTDFVQQKAIRHEGKTLISSEVLPATISCDNIVRNSFENQSVKVSNIHFSRTSPALRKTIRLLPEDKHTVSLFIHNQSVYRGRMTIQDISVSSVKLNFNTTPLDIKIGKDVVIDMILKSDGRSIIINCKARVFKKIQDSIVFSFHLDINTQNNLLEYITNRQIDIIKEFKVLGK